MVTGVTTMFIGPARPKGLFLTILKFCQCAAPMESAFPSLYRWDPKLLFPRKPDPNISSHGGAGRPSAIVKDVLRGTEAAQGGHGYTRSDLEFILDSLSDERRTAGSDDGKEHESENLCPVCYGYIDPEPPPEIKMCLYPEEARQDCRYNPELHTCPVCLGWVPPKPAVAKTQT